MDELSPRAPAQKRAKEELTGSSSAMPVSLSSKARNDLGWLTHCVGQCVLNKAMKVETSRSLLDRLASLTEVVGNLVTENAVLTGKLEEARLVPAMLTNKFAGVLAERDAVVDRLREGAYVANGSTRAGAPSRVEQPVWGTNSKANNAQKLAMDTEFPALPEVKRGRNKSGVRSTSRVASRSRARKALLSDKRAEVPCSSFVIVPPSGKTLEMAKSEVWKEVIRTNRAPKLSSVTGKSGKIVIKPHDKETADVLKALKNKGLLEEEAPLWPRIIISGVQSSLDAGSVVTCISEQNPELNIETGSSNQLKAVFKKGSRDRDTTSWVCDVSPSLFECIKEATVYIGFTRCRCRAFEDVTQCYACLGFGHSAQKCFEASKPGFLIPCAHCSRGGHKEAACPNRDQAPKCINCSGKHNARDRLCIRRSKALAAVLGRTSYSQ